MSNEQKPVMIKPDGEKPYHAKMGPLAKDHPCVGDICPGCKECLEIGEFVALVVVGPGDDKEARQRCREGKPYNGVAVAAHYACVTGDES